MVYILMDCELIEAEKDWIKSVLEQYRVSYTRGFVPDKEPLVILCYNIHI